MEDELATADAVSTALIRLVRLLERTRARLEELEKRVAELEARSSSSAGR